MAFLSGAGTGAFLYNKLRSSSNENKTSTIFDFIAQNETEKLRHLIEKGQVHVNTKNERDWTLLHAAAQEEKIVTVKMLFENGADVNAVDKLGMTPLHHAVIAENIQVISLLLDKGANVNARSNHGTPLHTAAGARNCELIKLLHEDETDDAEFDAVKINNIQVIQLLLENGADVNAKNDDGFTPYDLASSAEVRALLQVNNVSIKNKKLNYF